LVLWCGLTLGLDEGEERAGGDDGHRHSEPGSQPGRAVGEPGGQTPTIDVQVNFAGGESRDPKLAIAKFQVALVRLADGASAARASKARCFDMTSLRPRFRGSAKGGRCGAKVWLTVPGKTDANGIYHVRRTIGRLPRGRYESWSRTITNGGVVETKFVTGRNRVAFTVKR
jgi:hypothetical protein